MEHLDTWKMKIRKYPQDDIFEFDTLDELRVFDTTYIEDTRSGILKEAARLLSCREGDIQNVKAYKDGTNAAAGTCFTVKGKTYKYHYETAQLTEA